METGSTGALVTGSVALAQTTSPISGSTAALTGVAAVIGVELAMTWDDGSAGRTSLGSPPQLTSMPQASRRHAAPNDPDAVVSAAGRSARRSTGRNESLTQPTMRRSLPR